MKEKKPMEETICRDPLSILNPEHREKYGKMKIPDWMYGKMPKQQTDGEEKKEQE